MKKIITLAFLSILYLQGSSQIVQAGIGGGIQDECQPNEIKLYLRSDITLTNPIPANNIFTLQFCVRIPGKSFASTKFKCYNFQYINA
ncbi:MAG: hypothetical protein IPJ81_05600 [Chitinophagaceae bacterium]|nr:hypothetical protein [Chitinophagaceae bacterium]